VSASKVNANQSRGEASAVESLGATYK
jgi:hypothetical protein